MTALDGWLKDATRRLSKDSIAQVRTEIQQHYESAREAAMAGGASAEEADRLAVTALGDAKLANRQYRKVLLTAAEARMLRDGNREARIFCSRPWLKWILPAVSVGALAAAVALFLKHELAAYALIVFAAGIGFPVFAKSLPVYTPSRARVFRWVKWIVLAGAIALAFGPEARKWSWLLFSCVWPMVWGEWTRASIRRKLPVAQWPKQLYL